MPQRAHVLTLPVAFPSGEILEQGNESDDGREGHLETGSNTDCGVTTRTAKAAIATLRIVSAGRSSITAMSTMLIMIQERTVGTAAPDNSK